MAWLKLLIIGEEFIGDDDVCLVLGDNIFYGQSFSKMLAQAVENVKKERKATVFWLLRKRP